MQLHDTSRFYTIQSQLSIKHISTTFCHLKLLHILILGHAVTENGRLVSQSLAQDYWKKQEERSQRKIWGKKNTEAEEVLVVFCVKSKELCVGRAEKGKVREKKKK